MVFVLTKLPDNFKDDKLNILLDKLCKNNKISNDDRIKYIEQFKIGKEEGRQMFKKRVLTQNLFVLRKLIKNRKRVKSYHP